MLFSQRIPNDVPPTFFSPLNTVKQDVAFYSRRAIPETLLKKIALAGYACIVCADKTFATPQATPVYSRVERFLGDASPPQRRSVAHVSGNANGRNERRLTSRALILSLQNTLRFFRNLAFKIKRTPFITVFPTPNSYRF